MVLLVLLAACGDPALKPRRLTGAGVTPAVWGVLELPRSPGPHPAVMLLHGSYGWRPDYARFARRFADSGFVALAIDYYAETGRPFFDTGTQEKWRAWQQTVRRAAEWLDTLPSVAGRPIALVGYSRGAMIAISMAASVPGVGAVVDFYGAGPADSAPGVPWHYPPLLILHGDADAQVSVSLAHMLYDTVSVHAGDVEMHIYAGAQHAFNGPWASGYSARDAEDSWGRTIEFLRRRLTR
jgi:carboxymethylenebutenolidase